jgi:hypothetical protein
MLPTDVPDEIQRTLEVVVRLRDQLSADIEKGKPKAGHAGMAASLARSIKELSTEARQWSASMKAEAKAVSLQDRINAVVRFISNLGKADREHVFVMLDTIEKGRPDGLPRPL